MLPALDGLAAHLGVFAFGYLLGSIPFGVILTRLAGTGDVRAIGSGNIGATNVLRTGRKGLAAATLLGDMLKGTAAVLVIAYVDRGGSLPLVAGFGAFIGHLFPVWLKFKGGKGVATYIGILVALAWPIAIGFCLVWLAIAALTRYSSLAGLLASAATPVALWINGQRGEAVLFLVLTVLLWVRHHENIARLLSGTESKLGSKSATPASSTHPTV
jgi:glycerol-3-phosphate acyltransferase PlsY